jgi:hypothetical protein
MSIVGPATKKQMNGRWMNIVGHATKKQMNRRCSNMGIEENKLGVG